jgi:TIR domain
LVSRREMRDAVREEIGENISEVEMYETTNIGEYGLAEVWFNRAGEYDTAVVFYSTTEIEHVFRDFGAFARWLASNDTVVRPPGPRQLFVSHAHQDVQIATRLVAAIERYFVVPPRRLRCTSVPGHMLDIGATPRTTLRQELGFASTVIAVISYNSLASPWVLFELGAAWLQSGRVLPILCDPLTDQDLPGPLRGDASAKLSDPASVDRLLQQLETGLDWDRRDPAAARQLLSQLSSDSGNLTYSSDDLVRELQSGFTAKRARI